jgi:glycosyltransferase involved in cell wall biosynthesis
VRNESHVIERCLGSVRPLIDTWTIIDTGSTDKTVELAQGALAGIPGRVHSRPWVDFSTNRNELIELAQPTADYLLLLDADMVVRILEDNPMASLTAPVYDILVEQGHAPDSPSDISFAQFIEVVTEMPSRDQDPHWRRQTDHIGFGIVKFDDIIRLNELDASWDKVAKLTRTPDLQDQFFCRNSTGASSKITDFYTPELLARVVESYSDDYKEFGFAVPSLNR